MRDVLITKHGGMYEVDHKGEIVPVPRKPAVKRSLRTLYVTGILAGTQLALVGEAIAAHKPTPWHWW
jgi:hypothetical protein